MKLTFRTLWLAALVLGATASFAAADVVNGGFEDDPNEAWFGCPLGDCPPTTSTYVVIQGGSNSYLQMQAAADRAVSAEQSDIFVEACVRNAGYATLQFDARYGSDCGAASVTLNQGGVPVPVPGTHPAHGSNRLLQIRAILCSPRGAWQMDGGVHEGRLRGRLRHGNSKFGGAFSHG